MKDTEIWKPIPRYKGYFASNLGRIKSKHRIRKCYLGPIGYWTLNMTYNGKRRTEFVHRLVCESFRQKDIRMTSVNHINGIKTDNRIENLEWANHSTNGLHAYRIGLRKPANTKYDPIEITAIRDARKAGFSCIQISGYLKTSRQNITRIISGKRWHHVPL